MVFIYWKLFFSHCNYFYRIGFAMSKLLFFHVTQFVFLIVTRFGARFDDGRRLRTNGYHLWCSLSTLNEMEIAIYETRHHYNRYYSNIVYEFFFILTSYFIIFIVWIIFSIWELESWHNWSVSLDWLVMTPFPFLY